MSNSLDPDQAQHFVGPDLVLNCLQMLSADDTGGQRVIDSEIHQNFQIYLFFFLSVYCSISDPSLFWDRNNCL